MGTIAKLAEMIACHDLTYEYSDDPRCYRRGRDEKAAIAELAKDVPVSVYHALWNDKVLRGIKWDYCGMFLKGETRREHDRMINQLAEKG